MIRRDSQLVEKLRSDPTEAMETAKSIIRSGHMDFATLRAVATDRNFSKWGRIAAIYAMGFGGKRASVVLSLLRILSDDCDDIGVRSYAAEALGTLGDANAVNALAQTALRESQQSELRKSCEYALEQIYDPLAKDALERLHNQAS
jgi:HEAT repeat protein